MRGVRATARPGFRGPNGLIFGHPAPKNIPASPPGGRDEIITDQLIKYKTTGCVAETGVCAINTTVAQTVSFFKKTVAPRPGVVYYSPHTHTAYRFSAVLTGKPATVENTMNKKLVTLAVAAAMAAPAAAMADAVLYGKLNVAIDYVDQDNGFDGWGLSGNQGTRPWNYNPYNRAVGNNNGPSNRIGVKGSEDLGNGLKAIYQVEFGVDLTDTQNTAVRGNEAVSMRNSYVGLAGNWGTVLMGRHDTPLKISTAPLDMFADTMADYNNTVGFNDLRVDNAIAYISPSFSGFQFAGAVHAGGGAMVNGFNEDSNSLAEAYSLAGIYKNGPFYGSLAYESLGEDLATTQATRDAFPGVFGDFDKLRVGLGILDWNGFSLTGIYETVDGAAFLDSEDGDLWQIQAGYSFNNFMVKAMYGDSSVDGLGVDGGSYDWSTWAVGADYNFSKRTKAFMLYTDNDADSLCGDDDDEGCSIDWQGFQLGVMHSF
jgi:predicted porin